MTREEKDAAILARIESRIVEDGGCRRWMGQLQGYSASKPKHRGCPALTIEGKTTSLRRWLYRQWHGEIPAGLVISPACGDHLCLSKRCLQAVTESQSKQAAAARGVFSGNLSKNRKNAMTRRAGSWITDEVVEQVRAASSAAEAARLTGVSLGYCKDIRAGKNRRDYSSPFVSLMPKRKTLPHSERLRQTGVAPMLS